MVISGKTGVMIHDTKGQKKAKPVNWLCAVSNIITFAQYENIGRLQAAISPIPDATKPGQIEAIAFKRGEAIKLWHRFLPLCILFVPLWLICIACLYNEPLPNLQSVGVLYMIGVSAIAYLLTFYRDSLRYQSHLIEARQNLLSVFNQEAAPVAPQDMRTHTIPIPKGCIPMFLLNELLKKEAGHSNIFNASVDEVMPFCKKMIGFDEKNFKKVLSQYRRRDDIVLDTENARTTHIGYLDILIQHYHVIGEKVLEQQAIALQTFLNRTPLKAAG